MTKAIFKKQDGLYVNLEVKGHSGFASSGSDIVCAGISTAVIISINLIDRLIPNSFEIIQNEAVGYICLKNILYSKMDESVINNIQIIFDNLYETLLDIQANYQNHLKVKIENN